MAQGSADDVVAYGQWLYECLLAPSWPDISTRAEVLAAGGVELALRWPADDEDLHNLVWEAMHSGGTALAANPGLLVAITRVVPAGVPPPVPTGAELRLLLAAGTALTNDVIRAGTLFMGLLRGFESPGPCTVRVAQSLTVDELTEICSRFRPHIVHLVAHECLEGDRYAVELGPEPSGGVVGIRALLPALARGHRPTAVVLSVCRDDGSCDGSAALPLATQLATGGIAVVVAMAGDISEPPCWLYTRQLIRAVGAGTTVAAAAAQGRRAALLNAGVTPDHLDWAMPALFLADSVPPGFQIVDPEPRQRVVRLAETLKFRRGPLFVGRSDVLAATDRLLSGEPDSPGFIGIVQDGPIDSLGATHNSLGATRLLREISNRLLARGHVPLLLDTYRFGGTPAHGRELVADILLAAARFGAALNVAPPASRVLGDESQALADWRATAGAIAAFRDQADGLDQEWAKRALSADLDQLASAVGAAGPPFGPHSRPVILGDDVHTWITALEVLLAMVDRDGLGRASAPIPVVITASLREGMGPMLKAFVETHVNLRAFASYALEPMPPAELAISSQWLLMHPWRPGDPAYAPARGASPAMLQQAFALVKGPAAFETDLHLIAQLLVAHGQLVTIDADLLTLAGRLG
jgi:hypothetical protein